MGQRDGLGLGRVGIYATTGLAGAWIVDVVTVLIFAIIEAPVRHGPDGRRVALSYSSKGGTGCHNSFLGLGCGKRAPTNPVGCLVTV